MGGLMGAALGIISLAIVMLMAVVGAAISVQRKMRAEVRIKELECQVAALTEGKKAEEEAQVQTESHEDLLQGMVTKTAFQRGNRRGNNYQLTDRVPQFKTVEEAVQFGLGLFTTVDDPTVINLAGYGTLSKTDSYIALRLVAQGILKQISELRAEESKAKEVPDLKG